MVYIAALILLLIPAVRCDLMGIQKGRIAFIVLIWLALVLIAGLRFRVGGDTLIYMTVFERYPTISELGTFDFEEAEFNRMWYIYNSIFKTFGDSFLFFQIVQAMIVNTIFMRFFFRHSPAPFICLLLYFVGYYCYFNMEVLREALCIGVLLEAYPLIIKRNWIAYYLCAIFAVFIHTSAVVLFVLPFCFILRRDDWRIALIISIGLGVFLSVFDVINIAINLAFDGAIAEKIYGYISEQLPNIIGKITQYFIVLPFILIMYLRKRRGYEEDREMGLMLMFCVAVQTSAMFIPFIHRLSNYLMPFGLVYLTNTLYVHYRDWRKDVISIGIVSVALVVYTFNLGNFYFKKHDDDYRGARTYMRYTPYYTYIDPQMDKRRELILLNERTIANPFQR